MLDLSKLTPAPWKRVMLTVCPEVMIDRQSEEVGVTEESYEDSGTFTDLRKYICRCECTKGKYEIEEANCEFIALARNAFDGDPEALAWWEENRRKPTGPTHTS